MSLGGLGVACQGLVKGLLKRDVKVTLALPHRGHEDGVDTRYPTETTFESIKVCSMLTPYDSHKTYGERVTHVPTGMREIYGSDLGQAIEYFTASAVEMTKDVNPDIVHCHDWMTYEAGIRAAKHHRKPLVAHIHATELDRTNNSPNPWIYNRELRGFQQADKIVAVSHYTKNTLVTQYGISPDKIAVVHNGNSDHFANNTPHMRWETPRRHRPMVLFLGRLAQQKGTHQFLDMAAEIHRIRPEVEFVMAGTGELMGELIDRTISLNLQDSIIFAGKVKTEEARILYNQADCFVMPSLSEPFGLVALEAVTHGTPVVLSRQSGAAEVLSHAFVVDFWDTSKMADCVLTILRDEPLAHQLRSESFKDIQRLTWENQADAVTSVYRDTISSLATL